MFVFFSIIIAIAIYGGNVLKLEIFGFSIMSLFLLLLSILYIKYFVTNYNKFFIDKFHFNIILFEIYGIIYVIMSYLEIFLNENLIHNSHYIPRQSYYLFILPLIILISNEKCFNSIKYYVKKYNVLLFCLVYLGHIILTEELYLTVSSTIVLSAISILNKNSKISTYHVIQFLIIILTPISSGGEMTNIIIKFIYSLFFIINVNKRKITKIMSINIILVFILMFFVPLFSDYFKQYIDINTYWRLTYWNDEIHELVNSNFLGVGYGTSYATENFIINYNPAIGGPFAANEQYSVLDKIFVVGPHNSYISVIFRLGVVGFFIFVYYFINILKELIKFIEYIDNSSLFLYFSSIFLITFNVGLESPYYLFIFVASQGIVLGDLNKVRNIHKNKI